MNITFIEDCPPVQQTGWSAYTKGARATLENGAHLVEVGLAREGWGAIKTAVPTPAPVPEPVKQPRKTRRKATKGK